MASRRGSKGEGHVFSLSLSKNSAGGGGGRRRSRENSLGSSHGQGSAASLDDAVPDYQLFEGSVWPTTPLEESLPVLPLSSADDIAVTDVVDDEDQLAALKLTLTGAKLSQQSLLSNPGRPSTTDGIVRRYSVAPEEMMLPTSRRASFSHDPSSGLGASLRPSMTDLGPSVSSPTQGPGLLQMRRASLSPLSPSISRLPSIIRESSSSAPAITAIAQKTAIQEEDGQRDKQRQIRRESADHEKPSMTVPPSAHASLNNFMSMMSIGTVEAYPALLSEVAQQFKAHIRLTTHTKDSIDYQDSFTGHDAISSLCAILKSPDRNLATLVGRALSAQGFLFDVTYSKKLKDSKKEIYRCYRSVPGEAPTSESSPTGVFTILTDCFVSTCTKERMCYSVSCPRRLAQVCRMRGKDVHRTASLEKEKQDQLWCMTVPQEVLDSVSDGERKRQEIIFEIIQTEREFVDDLLLIQKVYVTPLMGSDIIEPVRRESFLSSVFLNMRELYNVNSKLFRKLIARQNENYVVYSIGDIFVNIVDEFYPYVEYGSQQIMAKFLLDEEKANNPEFVKFLKECEKNKECRKLPLESFLARPTTRMGRYPLFLKSVFEKLPENHPDKKAIPQALATLKDILSKINAEAGKAENVLKLSRLQKQIVFNTGEEVDLHLNAENRRICREGMLTLKRGAATESEVTVFLFDHMFVMAKKKDNGTFKVYKKPIPLELLVCKRYDRAAPMLPQAMDQVVQVAQKTSIARMGSHVGGGRPPSSMGQARPDVKSNLFTITHLGRNGAIYTFSTYSNADRQAWMEVIEFQQKLLMDKKRVFELLKLDANVFKTTNRVNCSTSYSSLLIVGTDDGLYTGPERVSVSSDLEEVPPKFTKVLNLEKVTQVDVLPDHDMLVVLADRNLFTFTLDVLDLEGHHDSGASRRGKRIGSHVSFFKQGVCAERTLVCAVKSTSLTATIKVLEPVGLGGSKLRGKLGKLFRTTNDSLRVFKEFYIPTESRSVHYLRTKLCVGCTKGFEIVDLETLNTQGLIDPTDENLDFVSKRDNVKPIAIFRIRDGEFFLCYNEFGFFVDKLGRRYRDDYLVFWSGSPSSFSYIAPYIIAIEPSHIEVRHIESGDIQQIIPTTGIRCLNNHPDILHLSMGAQQNDVQEIVKLVLIADATDNLQ